MEEGAGMSGDSHEKPRGGANPGDSQGERPRSPCGGHDRRPGSRGPAKRRPTRPGGPKRPGAIRLAPIGGNRFEFVHPSCVRETELDFEEGMEIWRAGDPEGARDALRYALAACRDNLWIHVGLGRIALEEFNDPGLARGHFGYAVTLCERTITPSFSGILPLDRPSNRPFYDAVDGLIRCLDALGRRKEVAELRALRKRLSGADPEHGKDASPRPDPGV